MLLIGEHPITGPVCIVLFMLLCCHRATAQRDTIMQPAVYGNDTISSKASAIVDSSRSIVRGNLIIVKKDSTLKRKAGNIFGNIRIASGRLVTTIAQSGDTLISQTKHQTADRKNRIIDSYTSRKQRLLTLPTVGNRDSVAKTVLIQPFAQLFRFSKPYFQTGGGYISYNFNYRSNTDTPYAERDIVQHLINASYNFSIAGLLPFTANAWLRRSNSQFYRDITDVQITFNAAAFQAGIVTKLKERLAALGNTLHDSLLEQTYLLNKNKLIGLGSWVNNPLQFQKLVQANETLKVPEKYRNPALPDSLNNKNLDALQANARAYIDAYNQKKEQYDSTKRVVDSLGEVYQAMKERIAAYQSFVKSGALNATDYVGLQQDLAKLGVVTPEIPASMKWLLNVRSFSLGKTGLNQSELTTKNVSLNGVNFEYNAHYYFAVSAGLVDYRFNEVIVNPHPQALSYMYVLRAGIGNKDRNHIILSYFGGKKQLNNYAVNGVSPAIAIPVAGMSAEARWQLNENSYAVAEVAQSFSPDYHYNPAQKPALSFSDNSNKAVSLKIYSFLPLTGTKLEGMYKNSGANFQSFNSYQTTAALQSWYIKGDQFFFKRKLRITASVRSNDFSNPYIQQNYKSNTIFTSLTATMRIRKLPVLTIGYTPMSQFTMVADHVVENRFQTLMVNASHFYKLGSIRASSFISFSKFYNTASDTGFIFFNAGNLLAGQSFYFKLFTANINFSRSVSPHYILNVASEDISFSLTKRGSVGIGVRINHFNNIETKVGQFINLNYQIGKMDYLIINYERGYLPGAALGNPLRLNQFGNVQFIKRF